MECVETFVQLAVLEPHVPQPSRSAGQMAKQEEGTSQGQEAAETSHHRRKIAKCRLPFVEERLIKTATNSGGVYWPINARHTSRQELR